MKLGIAIIFVSLLFAGPSIAEADADIIVRALQFAKTHRVEQKLESEYEGCYRSALEYKTNPKEGSNGVNDNRVIVSREKESVTKVSFEHDGTYYDDCKCKVIVSILKNVPTSTVDEPEFCLHYQ